MRQRRTATLVPGNSAWRARRFPFKGVCLAPRTVVGSQTFAGDVALPLRFPARVPNYENGRRHIGAPIVPMYIPASRVRPQAALLVITMSPTRFQCSCVGWGRSLFATLERCEIQCPRPRVNTSIFLVD